MAQKKSRQFSPVFREAAAREVVEKSRLVADVARDCGVTDQTIRNWVKQFQRTNSAADTGLSMPEHARLKELERRVRELEDENRFLGKDSGRLRGPERRLKSCAVLAFRRDCEGAAVGVRVTADPERFAVL
ncbi:transposase [Nocardia sp. NPDC046763]|uniref:transposase n=1 Tax=Nocardia sp. NPDC046763 TaxID=3155256 RepID=UPI0033BFDE2F